MGGEVDIMERLNHDSIVYQTVHSHYTYTLGIENNPKHGNTIPINPEDFNVYGVDFCRTVLYSMSTENETLFILELKPNKKDSFLLISRNIC